MMNMNHYIQTPHHHHPMARWSSHLPYECGACKETGFHQFYNCSYCKLHLHDACANALPSTIHPLNHAILLNHRPSSTLSRSCDACATTISGSSYRHKPPGILSTSSNLHPRCALLPSTISEDGLLQLHLVDGEWSKTLRGLKCQLCLRKSFSGIGGGGGRGWSYVSSCGELGYHVACVKRLVHDRVEKKGFEGFYGGAGCSTVTATPERSAGTPGHRLGGLMASKFMVKVGLKIVLSAILGDPTIIFGHFIIDALF